MRGFRSSIFHSARPFVLVTITCLIVISAGCGAIPFSLRAQATPTLAALPTPAITSTVVATATLPVSPTTEANPSPTATLVQTPNKPPPTIVVQAVPSLQPTFTPIPTGGGTTRSDIHRDRDNGVSGPKIGCGDSAVGVIRVVPPTRAPLTAALNELFSLHDQFYGQSGLYNSLYQSHLQLQSATIVNGIATIKLTGTLSLGGVCDDPRVDAQITNTALQFADRALGGRTPQRQTTEGCPI